VKYIESDHKYHFKKETEALDNWTAGLKTIKMYSWMKNTLEKMMFL